MRLRVVGVWLVVAGGLLGVALGAGEILVRSRERSRSTPPGVMPTLYYRHVRLRHALVRDYAYFGWVRTDSAGFRRTIDATSPTGGRPRVLVLGASTTFDTQVSGDLRAWPSRLWTWLSAEQGFQGAVLNGGVAGYQVVDNLVRLVTVLANFQPDVILLYHAHNDLFATLAGSPSAGLADPHRPWRAPTQTPWAGWLEAHSLLYGKVAGRLKALRFGGTGGDRRDRGAAEWDSVLNAGAARFERDVETFAAVAAARGIPLVLMTVTHVSAGDSLPASDDVARNWMHTLPGVPPGITLEGYRRFNARVAAVAARHSIPLIDGAASGVAGLELYAEGDPLHFNDRGADEFARFVAGQLGPFLTSGDGTEARR